MRKIDESERPMPEIDLAKVCFIIEKSREYVGEEVGAEADDSNSADDDERVMLTETAGPSIRRELIEFIKDLDVDEAAAVVTVAWISRDMQPEEWKIAVAQAKGEPGQPGSPRDGAAAGLPRTLFLGRSCESRVWNEG
jgi:hypothetical protein